MMGGFGRVAVTGTVVFAGHAMQAFPRWPQADRRAGRGTRDAGRDEREHPETRMMVRGMRRVAMARVGINRCTGGTDGGCVAPMGETLRQLAGRDVSGEELRQRVPLSIGKLWGRFARYVNALPGNRGVCPSAED